MNHNLLHSLHVLLKKTKTTIHSVRFVSYVTDFFASLKNLIGRPFILVHVEVDT